jgi:hypothetical protein
MHLTDRCRFLRCSVRRGGGGVRIKGVEGWEGEEEYWYLHNKH